MNDDGLWRQLSCSVVVVVVSSRYGAVAAVHFDQQLCFDF